MNIYILKIALRGVSPMIWRRLHIPGNTSLAKLHQIIQITNQWDNEYLHQFHIFGKDYGISYIGGIAFSDNPDQIYLDNFTFDVGDKFTYEYNFFEHHIVDIRVEEIKESLSSVNVFCIKGNGMPGVTNSDVIHAKYNLLKAITHMNPKTKLKKLLPWVEALQETQFNHHRMNQKLLSELTEQS